MDVCDDPANAQSDYCRERLPGESIAQYNARRVAELETPLEVTVRRGVQAPTASVAAELGVPPLALAALVGAVLGWFLLRGSDR